MATGNYISTTDIERKFGKENVRRWSALDSEGAEEIDDRQVQAIAVAEAFIDDSFRDGMYVIPFASCPTVIADLCATYAGLWLYENRGMDDDADEDDPLGTMMSARLKRADQDIAAYIKGEKKVTAPLNEDGPTAPVGWTPK